MSDARGALRLRRVDDVVSRKVAGEVFLVPIRGHLADLQHLFVLNEVGSWTWERLDGAHSVDELTLEMLGEFEVTEEKANSDVQEFLKRLSEAGLVEEVLPPKG